MNEFILSWILYFFTNKQNFKRASCIAVIFSLKILIEERWEFNFETCVDFEEASDRSIIWDIMHKMWDIVDYPKLLIDVIRRLYYCIRIVLFMVEYLTE